MDKKKIIPFKWLAGAIALVVAIGLIVGSQMVFAKEITIEEAVKIALDDAKVQAKDVSFVNKAEDYDNGRKKFDINFYTQNKEYDYEIDSKTGKIVEKDMDIENFELPPQAVSTPTTTTTPTPAPQQDTITQSNPNEISEERAKNIAIGHSLVDKNKITYINVRKDIDDGKVIYEVEFAAPDGEFDYNIDALTGEIISVDMERY